MQNTGKLGIDGSNERRDERIGGGKRAALIFVA
jgi:hypothetical protein